MVQVVVVVAVGGTGLGVGMHIDGAGRRLLKLIPHQSFYKRAVGQVQRRLRIYIYLYDISYYIEWSGVEWLDPSWSSNLGVCLRKLHMRIGFN